MHHSRKLRERLVRDARRGMLPVDVGKIVELGVEGKGAGRLEFAKGGACREVLRAMHEAGRVVMRGTLAGCAAGSGSANVGDVLNRILLVCAGG